MYDGYTLSLKLQQLPEADGVTVLRFLRVLNLRNPLASKRRGARGLGLRPEATLGLRLIPLKRGFAPPESYPVAPPAAPEAPR